MANYKVEHQSVEVDIYKYPTVIKQTQAHELTVGDLHGNSILLLHFLVTWGIVSISEENYLRLVKIYKTYSVCAVYDGELIKENRLTKENINEFEQIVANLKVNTGVLLRLIGDELSDRGQNDGFTLLILAKLHKEKLAMSILHSNHGHEALRVFEKNQTLFTLQTILFGYCNSMMQMYLLIEKGVLDLENVHSLMEKNYLPHLTLLGYSLIENQISIFSHAPIGLETIFYLAKKFEIEYKDNNIEELAQTIDKINEIFREHVNAKTVHTLPVKINNGGTLSSKEDPFTFAIWNRNYVPLKRPARRNNYSINWIHGHDLNENNQDHIINLDNTDFKGVEYNKGKYSVLVSLPEPQCQNSVKEKVNSIFTSIPESKAKTSTQPKFSI